MPARIRNHRGETSAPFLFPEFSEALKGPNLAYLNAVNRRHKETQRLADTIFATGRKFPLSEYRATDGNFRPLIFTAVIPPSV